ncbi:MAG: SpoIIE family protein phosphatase [Ignavibacteria bacterium]|jgi:serine phosphatase RsbU (regulator of sigma subunit)
MIKIISFFLILFTTVNAQKNLISSDSLLSGKIYNFDYRWKYSEGNDPAWAKKEFNDSTWEMVDSRIPSLMIQQNKFNGEAWFRKKIIVNTSLINIPVGILYFHSGESEIYLNGNLIHKINNDLKFPFAVSFTKDSNLIAIHYKTKKHVEYSDFDFYSGISFRIADLKSATDSNYNDFIEITGNRVFFISVALALALFHLILFLFDKRSMQNFYYAIFLVSFSVFIFINFQSTRIIGLDTIMFFNKIGMIVLLSTILFASTTIYSFYNPLPKYYYVFPLTAFLIGLTGYFYLNTFIKIIGYIYIALISYLGSTCLFDPRYKKKFGGEWIIRTGFALMGVLGIYQMLISLGVVDVIAGFYAPYMWGVLIFVLSMSISLARDYALTGKDLEYQLANVKELTEKTMQQELNQKLLEAENDRKSKELEEARNLQLSMLPQCLNDIPGFDICFDMKTATEVGGDYYDYQYSRDGTLTVVIGDATGHGTKAGNMVVLIKSLFNAMGHTFFIPDFFNHCSRIIRRMNFNKLYMALAMIKIRNNKMTASSAGIPPIYIFRKDKNEIEKFLIRGMPLGALEEFHYEQISTKLNPGDVILLQTDGFSELFNDKKELLGDERVKQIFHSAVDHNDAARVSQILFNEGKIWRGDYPQTDDITFVIIKIT